MQFVSHYPSPIGSMTLASNEEALIGVWFDGQKHFGSTLIGETEYHLTPALADTMRWLDDYFAGQQPIFRPPIELHGSPFQLLIWELLTHIPYGQTTTYKQLAEQAAQRIGRQHMSAQAIGGAVSRNPISLIVPCHRVLATDGLLTGYAGGIDRKRALLKIEGCTDLRK